MSRGPYAETVGRVSPPIEAVRVGVFRIPTDAPESDGTLLWSATTLVVVELRAGSEVGLGYTYADAAVAEIVAEHLQPALLACDALATPALSAALLARLRNLGRGGLIAMAVSAVDIALWDLKARHFGVPLVSLLGAVRAECPVYGSGGFTSYSDAELRDQFQAWAEVGIRAFKMKVGREPARDFHRVRSARAAIGPEAELFVDANGAYTRRQALESAQRFVDGYDVRWLEEPLPADDLEGLRFVRDHAPAPLEIAGGEYGYGPDDFRRLLQAGATDVVMPDATRCGGITGFLKAAVLCDAWHLPVSSHCAPALHVHLGCAIAGMRHAEYFHDHARIERMLFDGVGEPEGGALRPDLTRPGLGLEFKWTEAERYAV